MIKLHNPIIIHCTDNCVQMRTVTVFLPRIFKYSVQYIPPGFIQTDTKLVQILEHEPGYQYLSRQLLRLGMLDVRLLNRYPKTK